MVLDICLDAFGEALQKIRKDLYLTQKDVSHLSGINPETIRRIENGKVIPKFETLELLSAIYKQDINSLFLEHRFDDYTYFFELLNRIEGKFDRDEFLTLDIEVKELNIFVNCITNLFYKTITKQLILLTEAVLLYKAKGNNEEALSRLITAMKISTPNFDLYSYESFTYSAMEIRILMNIGFVIHNLGHVEEYLNIMELCIDLVDSNDEIYPKLSYNLAGAYRRNQEFLKALEYYNKGIKACQEIRNFNGLHLLYYGKGIAEHHLNKIEYKESINMSLVLCKALGLNSIKDKIIHNCNEIFGMDL